MLVWSFARSLFCLHLEKIPARVTGLENLRDSSSSISLDMLFQERGLFIVAGIGLAAMAAFVIFFVQSLCLALKTPPPLPPKFTLKDIASWSV